MREILERANVPADKIPAILRCIEFHEEYPFSAGGNPVEDIETLILQDADNLDAIGAVGIARTFAFDGERGLPIWLPEIPFQGDDDFNEAVDNPSMLHHFYEKLLRLAAAMNTETAKLIAQGRHQFMEAFLKQFFAEWNGEK